MRYKTERSANINCMYEHKMELLEERIDDLKNKDNLTDEDREELLYDEEYLEDLRIMRWCDR